MKQLKEDLQSARTEGDDAASEKPLDSELERMQTRIGCLTEERDQLQEILQGLREEKSQLMRELEEKDEMVRADTVCLMAVVFFTLSQGYILIESSSSCVPNEESKVTTDIAVKM